VTKENMIFEEWLLRDETSLIRQLGYDVYDVAERHVRAAPAVSPAITGEIGRTLGQLPPPVMPPNTTGAFDVEDFVRRSYHEIWNWRLLNKIREHYAPSHVCYTAGSRKFQGSAEYTAFVLAMFGMFPDAGVTVDHVYWNGNETAGYRVAVRWTLSGTHTGYGTYGEPSGARIQIMGLSQHHVNQGQFVQEYTLFDEMGLIKQIVAARIGQG
jgi:predicted ester cyclase